MIRHNCIPTHSLTHSLTIVQRDHVTHDFCPHLCDAPCDAPCFLLPLQVPEVAVPHGHVHPEQAGPGRQGGGQRRAGVRGAGVETDTHCLSPTNNTFLPACLCPVCGVLSLLLSSLCCAVLCCLQTDHGTRLQLPGGGRTGHAQRAGEGAAGEATQSLGQG